MQLEAQNQQHAIENRISFRTHQHMIVAELVSDHSTALISLYGAQVLSFIPNGQKDLLFVSQESFYQEGKAIRGGIPVCWPWFGGHPTEKGKPSHGFARLSHWQVIQTKSENGNTVLQLGLCDSDKTRNLWPFSFDAMVTITVGKSLQVEMTTRNTGEQPFTITGALHTYFNVSQSEQVSIEGLKETSFMDDVKGVESRQEEPLLKLKGEVDRCYLDTTGGCIIDDPAFDRKIKVEKQGSKSTVVWNPGANLAKQMKDLGDGEFASMVCVEAANALKDQINLMPGESHTLSTQIGLV